MRKTTVSIRRCLVPCCCAVLLTAPTVALADVSVPDGDLNVESGYLQLAPNAKGIVFPDKSLQTTAAPSGIKTILNGEGDPIAPIGTIGDFYLNTATNTLFGPKTVNGWPAGVSLVGPTGAQGSQGIQGVKGDTGATGPQGLTGASGANGIDGKTIWSGTSDPAAATGANGDFYINTADNKIFGPKASGAWPAGVSLLGPRGTGYTAPRAPVLATGQVIWLFSRICGLTPVQAASQEYDIMPVSQLLGF